MRRRGFTLLEIMLAAMIAGLIALAALGFFNMMAQTDRAQATRFDQHQQLYRTRFILNKVMTSLVVGQTSSAARNQNRNAPGGESGGDGAPGTGGGGGGGGESGGGRGGGGASGGGDGNNGRGPSNLTLGAGGRESATTGTRPSAFDSDADTKSERAAQRRRLQQMPRFILKQDDTQRLRDAMLDAGLGSSISGIQRLEVVVERPPVEFRGSSGTTATDEDNARTALGAGALRGAFELRPSASRATEFGNGPLRWDLWWRPLPPPDPDQPEATDAPAWGKPLLIMTDLTDFSWSVFDDGEKKKELTAYGEDTLPAWVEVELRTAGGMYANWMFELSWLTGDEAYYAEPDEASSDDGGTGSSIDQLRERLGPGGGRGGRGRGGGEQANPFNQSTGGSP